MNPRGSQVPHLQLARITSRGTNPANRRPKLISSQSIILEWHRKLREYFFCRIPFRGSEIGESVGIIWGVNDPGLSPRGVPPSRSPFPGPPWVTGRWAGGVFLLFRAERTLSTSQITIMFSISLRALRECWLSIGDRETYIILQKQSKRMKESDSNIRTKPYYAGKIEKWSPSTFLNPIT